MTLLESIWSPRDVKALTPDELPVLASEIREFLIEAVSRNGGHLGPNLGVVELTIALHRVFDSPADPIVWDTGHQSYVHKLLTGRMAGFARLRQQGGVSGYPSRTESEHDWVENSHASTSLSYADGLAKALHLRGEKRRRVVAVIGDGALTGGMAWEALNNIAGAKDRPVVIVVKDNGEMAGNRSARAPAHAKAAQPAKASRRGWTHVFADEMIDIGARRPDVVAITAAMLHPTGLAKFAQAYPDRVFDVGIAEQHAVASAAGLAMGGMHPVVAIYATFLNRAFDQVLMDVAMHGLPVTFVLDRAGVTGPDGASHHGMWDGSLLQIVPGIT